MVSTSTSLARCIHETSWSLCNVRFKVEIAFRSIRRRMDNAGRAAKAPCVLILKLVDAREN